MKISNLTIAGYQGISSLNLDIEQPILLVGGKNGTGKTTLRDAIHFVVAGESGRVKLKKDFDQLVRIGTDPKSAYVSMTADSTVYHRAVASGTARSKEDYPAVLPQLLGMSRFVLMAPKDQSALLFQVTGIKRDNAVIQQMLAQRGVGQQCIDQALPLLRSGFAAAEKACKERQSEARGAWQATTGETFGEAKANGWKATASADVPVAQLRKARDGIHKKIPDVEGRITKGEAMLADIRQHTHSSGVKYTCPDCQAALIVMQGKLVKDERDPENPPPPQPEQAKWISALNKLRAERDELIQQSAAIEVQIQQFENADKLCAEQTEKAAQYLAAYNEWKTAAEAFGPTGIDAELRQAALTPINKRLAATAEAAGWKRIEILSDLTVSYGNIAYWLLSESEQWRVDAAISEALAYLSGVKFFVLDRMDVLHPADRSKLLGWLLKIAPDHDTIIVLATLKNPPENLPAGIQSLWLEEGGLALEKAA